MTRLAARHVAVLTAMSVALAGALRADADPSSLLAGPSDFSGSETRLSFDDPGLSDGDNVPHPDLQIRFRVVIHRLGFELRANDLDDVAATLVSSGWSVAQATVPGRGSDPLCCYGFENRAGLDEVLLDVRATASGAFVLDNPPSPSPRRATGGLA